MTACAAPKEEQKSITFDWDHPRALRITEEIPTPTVEYVQIKQKQTTHVWDEGYLTNGKLTVEVPLNTYLYIDYESWQSPHTASLGSGNSREFLVTDSSPNSISIGVPIGYNIDHPFFEVAQDNETVDNTTIDNTTITVAYDNYSWSDTFAYNRAASSDQIEKYESFWDNVSTNDNWTYIHIGNPDNLVTCDNASGIINEFKKDRPSRTNKITCSGKDWYVGVCGQGNAISVGNDARSSCSCSTGEVWTVRPLIGGNNQNWGGVGTECRSQTQTLTVIFEK